MYAFLSHTSACEALRALEAKPSRWPNAPRRLPLNGACVSNQRSFKQIARANDLASAGIVTSPVDLIVPEQAMRSRGRAARFHVWSGQLPARSMLRISQDVFVSGPELVLVQFCGAQAHASALVAEHMRAVSAEVDALRSFGIDELPIVDDPSVRDSIERLVAAVVLACEFAGTYRLGIAGGQTRFHAKPLMSAESLHAALAQVDGTANKTRAVEVAGLFLDRSASPMETAVALMLTLPVNLGGLGLPRPLLNSRVDVSSVRGVLSDRATVKPDMLWRDQMVALEYDSSEFHERAGFAQLADDARRANILTACGYKVLRVTPGMMRNVADAELLGRQLAALLGVELCEPTEVQALRRQRLFSMLIPREAR